MVFVSCVLTVVSAVLGYWLSSEAVWNVAPAGSMAVVAGASVTLEDLRATGAARLARYKLPKDLVIAEAISRSPSGKPDYAWAREQVADRP